jgi:hypothetical protein
MIDLDAMRERDAAADGAGNLTEALLDRRALLNYVDELLAERALIVARAENAEAALVDMTDMMEKAVGLHMDASARLAEAEAENERMTAHAKVFAAQRDRAVGHLRDVLKADDGQAWKEARRFLDGIDAHLAEDA